MKHLGLVCRAAACALLVVATMAIPGIAQAQPADHPLLPVVYVTGSNEPSITADVFANTLRTQGFDVHVFQTWDPADPTTSPYLTVKNNSKRIAPFVEQVKAETGASQVDIVTFSQGGLVTRYWLKDFGGASSVRSLTSMSGLIKGSPFERDWLASGACPPPELDQYVPAGFTDRPTEACLSMAQDGPSVTALNTPAQALPGIHYTNITSRQEVDAAPYEINLMDGPGDYTNAVLEDFCPRDPFAHLVMNQMPSIQSAVVNALRGEPVGFRCLF